MALHPASPSVGQDQPLVPIPNRRQPPENSEPSPSQPSDVDSQRLASATRSEISLSPRLGAKEERAFSTNSVPPLTRDGSSGKDENLQEATVDKLLLQAWRKLGGESVLDQTKAILALVGILALFVQFWRMSSQSEPPPEE